ncbi:MAG: GDSL-type esterase/lipase family protein, partial [Ilumatobacteraceae bacterium]
AAVLVAAGCTSSESAASSEQEAGAPLPTIGLDSEFVPGVVSGGADVRAISADEVDTIVMIGDSITVASTEALEAEFAALGFDDPVIVSAVGKRMAESLSNNPSGAAIAEFLSAPTEDDADGLGDEHGDELWIVALGTNDIGQYSEASEVAVDVDEVLARVPPDAPLVWVDTYIRDRTDGTALVNDVITARIEQRGNAVVAPWSFFAGGEGVMRSDGVHPSESGTQVFAGVVSLTAARFLGR